MMGEHENFTLGGHVDHIKLEPKNDKLSLKGA